MADYYDKAVSGADRVDQRPGFREMLQRLASNGAKTIIVESPHRFARELAVQLAGHDMLSSLGIAIIPATAPDFFTDDTPTAVLVRQVLGAISQFEKAAPWLNSRPLASGSESWWASVRGASLTEKHGLRLSPSPASCAVSAPIVGNCHCVGCRRNSPVRAISTSGASPTLRSLWLRCCALLEPSRQLTAREQSWDFNITRPTIQGKRG